MLAVAHTQFYAFVPGSTIQLASARVVFLACSLVSPNGTSDVKQSGVPKPWALRTFEAQFFLGALGRWQCHACIGIAAAIRCHLSFNTLAIAGVSGGVVRQFVAEGNPRCANGAIVVRGAAAVGALAVALNVA